MHEARQNEDVFDVTKNKADLKDNLYYQQLQQQLSVHHPGGLNSIINQQRKVQAVPLPDVVDKVQIDPNSKSLFTWKTFTNKNGVSEVELELENRSNLNTSVLIGEKSLGIINVLGLRIDIREKMQTFIDKYIKNYVQSRSHNLMVAKFAQFNVAITGQILSALGMTPQQIEKLQKEALKAAVDENISMFEENEYNGEMIHLVATGKKEIKSQTRVVDEMRTQFVTQMQRLGQPTYYTEARIKEIQMEQLKKIITSFYEEKNNLEFQLNYM